MEMLFHDLKLSIRYCIRHFSCIQNVIIKKLKNAMKFTKHEFMFKCNFKFYIEFETFYIRIKNNGKITTITKSTITNVCFPIFLYLFIERKTILF